MVNYNSKRKGRKIRKSSKKKTAKRSAKRNKKSKGCGCILPRFIGGKKTRKNKNKKCKKKQRGGGGLQNLIPSDINNLGRSIVYTFEKNTAIAGGHDLPSNPSPVIQNEMDNH